MSDIFDIPPTYAICQKFKKKKIMAPTTELLVSRFFLNLETREVVMSSNITQNNFLWVLFRTQKTLFQVLFEPKNIVSRLKQNTGARELMGYVRTQERRSRLKKTNKHTHCSISPPPLHSSFFLLLLSFTLLLLSFLCSSLSISLLVLL